MYNVDAMNVHHEIGRRTERQMPRHQQVLGDDQETPITRGIHCRPVNTLPQPTMDTDHSDQESTTDTDHYDRPELPYEIVEMQTVSDTDTDHYDRPELPYEGLDATTVTPRVVVQQPSVYEDLKVQES